MNVSSSLAANLLLMAIILPDPLIPTRVLTKATPGERMKAELMQEVGQSPEDRRKQTMIKKYGVPYAFMIKKKYYIIAKTKAIPNSRFYVALSNKLNLASPRHITVTANKELAFSSFNKHDIEIFYDMAKEDLPANYTLDIVRE